jgi:hypothetical protein
MTSAHLDERASRPDRDHKPRVALLGANPLQLKTLRRILRAVVAGSCDVAETLEDLSPDAYDLLIVSDFDTLPPERREKLVATAADAIGRARLLIIAGGGNRDQLASLFSRRALTNLLAKNTEVNALELIVTVQKILRHDVFGLEKYFSWGVDAVCVRLRSSEERGPLVKDVANYAQQLGVNSRLASQFCSVADELITNAFYNAPRDEKGQARYAHLPRTQPIHLEPAEEIEIRYCCDGNRLGISASDPFGSLTEERLLDYLGKCLRKGDDQVDTKAGGAGLGLYYIFEAVSHLVVNIAPKRRTEIIGLIDVHGSYRTFADASKSFNIFVD